MFISGLQKLTLLDYPGAVACTVFTAGCNFRCPFCHNSPLVLPELMGADTDEEQVLKFLKKRQGVLEAVAVTGGEPLLHKELPDFLRKLRELGYRIKLDTNGSFPKELEGLIEAGLVDRVAMDIKNSPELYGRTIGLNKCELDKIERSKGLLMAGAVDYEFRTTLVKGLHSKDSVRDMAGWIAGAKEYYLQQYKDSGMVLSPAGLGAFDEEEMHEMRDIAAEFVPAVKLRGV